MEQSRRNGTVLAAIITGVATVIAAVVTGMFGAFPKDSSASDSFSMVATPPGSMSTAAATPQESTARSVPNPLPPPTAVIPPYIAGNWHSPEAPFNLRLNIAMDGAWTRNDILRPDPEPHEQGTLAVNGQTMTLTYDDGISINYIWSFRRTSAGDELRIGPDVYRR